MKKYREGVSPERAKVWTEKSPKYHQKIKKVQIVYYLSKNRQLEHPHFMEVLLSSPNGLYLRGSFNNHSLPQFNNFFLCRNLEEPFVFWQML